MNKKGRKRVSVKKVVQGAYVQKGTKDWLEKHFIQEGGRSASDLAGKILDDFVKAQKKKMINGDGSTTSEG